MSSKKDSEKKPLETEIKTSAAETEIVATSEAAFAPAGAEVSAIETAQAVAKPIPTGVKGFFYKLSQTKFCVGCSNIWRKFKAKHPNIAQFLVFFILSNGVTLLQLILMPLFKLIFNQTSLIDVNFQIGNIGTNFNGTKYYMFDYAAGAMPNGGGGLAYFLAVQITLAIAQIINFFAQRNITFKSKGNIWFAALWYFIAYICISIIAAALQGLYKTPIYNLFMTTWNMGAFGQTLADVITMIINSAISFWVFFPIFKLIFRNKKTPVAETETPKTDDQ